MHTAILSILPPQVSDSLTCYASYWSKLHMMNYIYTDDFCKTAAYLSILLTLLYCLFSVTDIRQVTLDLIEVTEEYTSTDASIEPPRVCTSISNAVM